MQAKGRAAEAALDWVEDGMVVGLGSGTTAALFIERLGERVRGGLRVRGVPTSGASAELARRAGIPLTDFEEVARLDLTVDGADEIDGRGDAIKGGGGALCREKVVAAATAGPCVAIVDESKIVGRLGAFPLPVEVLPFAAPVVAGRIEELGAGVEIRAGAGNVFLTDNGNRILDCRFGPRDDWGDLATRLDGLPGVVCHGIFLDLFGVILIGGPSGVRILRLRGEESRRGAPRG